MSGQRLRSVCGTLLVGAALHSCALLPHGTPTAVPTPATPAPLASSTPSLLASVDEVVWYAGPAEGEWHVVGLVGNPTDQPLLLSEIQVGLVDEAGAELASTRTPAPIRRLLPGEQCPFEVSLDVAAPAASVQVVAPAEPAGDVPRAILRTADLTARRQATGGWTIVGTVVNGTRTPALVDSLAILARRSDGEPAAVSTLASSCRYLGPNQRCPFLVEVPAPEGPLTWVAFIDAAATSPLPDPPLSQLEPPRLVLDSSGQPLVLGSLRNEDERARWLDGQVSLRSGGELLTVAWIRPPVPLAPGETRAFALSDFSGWQAISESETPDIDEIDIDLRLDPWGSAASEAGPLALQAEVTRFEQVGDRLFLRGVLGNGWSTAVIHPSALVSIRRTDGRLVSAGWVTAGQELAGGGSLGFLLVLPLPERADVAAAEFDLIGAGLPP